MAYQSFTEALDRRSDGFSIPAPTDQPLAYAVVAFLFLLAFYSTGQKKADIPELNPPKSRLRLPGIVPAEQAQNFIRHSQELFKAGRAKFPDQPYRLYSYLGDSVIIPPKFINDIRNEQSLDFQISAQYASRSSRNSRLKILIVGQDFHSHIPGFETFHGNKKLPVVINRHLTKALNKLTKPLSVEASLALSKKFGESTTEWLEIKPSSDMLNMVSRVSTRIFMGEELCRNEEWLNASAEYTACAFNAVEVLRNWPAVLRPWVAPFIPECKETVAKITRCREILEPFVSGRRAAKAKAIAQGEKPPVYDDSLEWFEKEYENYDAATSQIALSLFAIHTTSDLMSEIMTQLARHPEVFEPLRKEVIEVLSRDGLKKTALYNLKLMDSVIKECQRIKPVTIVSMQRRTVKPMTLSNGLTIPKGERVWVDAAHMWSDEYYKNADEFNAYRFMELRGTEKEHMAHLVSTSAEHVGFGHGEHACPGRFFAANELKILLCHMILKYEWKFPKGRDLSYIPFGLPLVPNPEARLLVRRRQEELNLDSLDC